MPNKKPVFATVEEVVECKSSLTAVIDNDREISASKDDLKAAVAKVDAAHSDLVGVVDTNRTEAAANNQQTNVDLRAYTDGAAQRVLDEVKDQAQIAEDNRAQTQSTLEKAMKAMDKDLRKTFEADLKSLREVLFDHIEQTKLNLEKLIEERRQEAAAARAQQRKELDATIEARRKELADDDARIRAETAAEFTRVGEWVRQLDEKQDANLKRNRKEIDARMDDMTDTMARNRSEAAAATSKVERESAEALEAVRAEHQQHLEDLDLEVSNLWDAMREVQEHPTRRIEWVIPNAAMSLPEPPEAEPGKDTLPYVSYFSKRFRAAGTRNLRLELRVYRPGEGPSGIGDTAIFLWAGRGMHIQCRLFIGEKWQNIDTLFEHRHDSGTKKLCFFKDEISKADGSLRVGLEILEAICEVDNESPQLVVGDVVEENGGGEFDESNGKAGELVFHRHINHRLAMQMRNEVERMQARMVKRVEWNIEQASKLQEYFTMREPIASPIFSAAGVEGMQLILYPSGYTGATEGYCSLFLYCPAGVTVRCTLSVGNQTRDAHNTFVEAAAYGRVNFCMYKGTWDKQSDVLTVAFEVQEIYQEFNTPGTNKDVASIVKMIRVPGSKGLTETNNLPSLWTMKSLGNLEKVPDDYNQMSKLKALRSGPDAMITPTPLRPCVVSKSAPSPDDMKEKRKGQVKESTGMHRSESTPAFGRTTGNVSFGGSDFIEADGISSRGLSMHAAAGFTSAQARASEVLSPPLPPTHLGCFPSGAPLEMPPGEGALPLLRRSLQAGDWAAAGHLGRPIGGSKKLRGQGSMPPLGTLPIGTYVPGLS
eukprot:TRINITY_DN103371_c0_g1_i1.p1 TRINITY_DN103371_c0_g1~~TRINITY_DN103371_c0_g1_i1.p1  ORF type:complete len:822 (-),score=197.77 TRINITY_DN103371_c0_g1_i1:367-2832(-)